MDGWATRRMREWNNARMTDSALAQKLRSDIQRSGYYPDLVADALETALAGEALRLLSDSVAREDLARRLEGIVSTLRAEGAARRAAKALLDAVDPDRACSAT